ncbi:DUF1501 domain-containing protein [Halosquirtibacter xylanolyticus]|uniref:DUF1501 domain-containing protein n=1 Tax=Halosquirtibacter xylanolyticus TaxID=3374599 RepID=UPI003749109A|nr:DUF1501 domain-containing protein [Prolixibacteraceae bacterium]
MDRRLFLRLFASATSGAMVIPNALSASTTRNKDSFHHENKVIFIQLNGGNDGLNTFIPYEDPLYYELRKTIAIPKEKLINRSNGIAFHPALKELANISQNGDLSLIQNVGYPNPNRSHFRSREIWQTASDSNEYITDGWLGRYLDHQYGDHSLSGINIDKTENLALKSEQINNITIKDLTRLHKSIQGTSKLVLSNNPQLDFVRKISYASAEGSKEISQALKKSQYSTGSYPNSALGNNLKWISKLVKSTLSTDVFYTSIGGFDTHRNQLFMHQRKLKEVNDAVYALYEDLKRDGFIENTTIVLFSEFGRRVKENGSGTDHGTAGPMVIIGGNNKGQIIGGNPNLRDLDHGDLKYQIDFRSVYASLLKDKLNFNPTLLDIQQNPLKGLF